MPNDLEAILKAGLRPSVEDVARVMGVIVMPSPRPGYVEYIKPETGIVVGCVPREWKP